jgi:hypothetical protein
MIFPTKVHSLLQTSFKIYSSEVAQTPISVINCFLGISAAYKIGKSYFGEKKKYIVPRTLKRWNVRTLKIIDLMGEISLILGALNSRPFIFTSRWLVKLICPARIKEILIGTNSIFDGRISKIIKIASVLFGIPSMIKIIYLLINAKKEKQLRMERFRERTAALRTISLAGSVIIG